MHHTLALRTKKEKIKKFYDCEILLHKTHTHPVQGNYDLRIYVKEMAIKIPKNTIKMKPTYQPKENSKSQTQMTIHFLLATGGVVSCYLHPISTRRDS